MSKVLITGISGNVGTYVYEALAKMNHAVVGAVTSVSKSMSRFQDIELVEFDFLNQDTYSKALEGVDRVFLMRPPHLGDPQDLYPFINCMKEKEIQLVVFLSLMGVEHNPIPPHHKIEKYIEKIGLPYCHIRPGFFMQNLIGVHAHEINSKNDIFIPAGKSKCSFIDAKDIGTAIATIVRDYNKHQNTSYTITGSESLNYDQVAGILSGVLKREITYSRPSWIKFRHDMIQERGQDKRVVNVMMMLYLMTRLGTASAVHDDYYKLTGCSPRTMLQFARDNISLLTN
jgi:uncharacterized protein YbjT (DUF2867 family)